MSRPRRRPARRPSPAGLPARPGPPESPGPLSLGFTLMEMTVALLVSGLAVLAAYGGLRTLSDASRRAGAAQREVMAPVNVRITLERWLRSTNLLLESRDRSEGGQPLNEMVFAVADAGDLRPGPHRVHLRVDLDPTTPGRGLVASLRPLGGGDPETLTLVPGATGLEIRYRVSEDGRRRWVSRWEREERMPDGVRLLLRETRRIRVGPTGEDRPGPRVATAGSDGVPPLLRLPLVVPLEVEQW